MSHEPPDMTVELLAIERQDRAACVDVISVKAARTRNAKVLH
jgi:hypothetical protein